MKLGEALAHLKREQSRLARLISLRKENVYSEKGKKTPFDPLQLGEQINKKIDDIRRLKIRIQKTNLTYSISDKDVSLAEAILLIGDIRSKIAHLSTLFSEKKEYSYRLRGKDDIEKIAQLSESEIEKEMEQLEAEKARLDSAIQVVNWKFELAT